MRSTAAALLFCVLALPACKEDVGGFGEAKRSGHSDQPIDKAAKPEAPPPDFNKAAVIAPAYDKATGQLTVTLKLQPGFHAYAPGEQIGQPVELAVHEAGGWKVEGQPTIPAGKEKDLGDLGKSVILEGDVPLVATVKGGEGPIRGDVKVQICTDKACDRPKKHGFEVATN